MLGELLKRYARYSGVACIQPKVLIRDDSSLEDSSLKKSLDKVTVSGATPIIKFFEEDKYPALAANEYACLRAAKVAGLPVPAVWLSADSQCLVVERFDIKPDGTCLALEDCCALAGFQPRHKYIGTYEQVAKALAAAIAPAHAREDMGIFFRSLSHP
jgi:serine/threonine-protein kinase HipA